MGGKFKCCLDPLLGSTRWSGARCSPLPRSQGSANIQWSKCSVNRGRMKEGIWCSNRWGIARKENFYRCPGRLCARTSNNHGVWRPPQDPPPNPKCCNDSWSARPVPLFCWAHGGCQRVSNTVWWLDTVHKGGGNWSACSKCTLSFPSHPRHINSR